MPGPVPILVPSPTNYNAPATNLSWIGNLPNAYAQGQVTQNQLDRMNVFKQGVPTVDGKPDGDIDWKAAAAKLYPLGDFNSANSLMQTGLQMGLLSEASKPMTPPGGGDLQTSVGGGTGGGAGNGAGGASRNPAVANNNPGNLIDGPWTRTLPGYTGSDGHFAQFDTPQHGAQAADANLQSYAKKGWSTPNLVTAHWAPKGDGKNDPIGYGKQVAAALGVGPDDQIDLNDPAVRQKIGGVIFGTESGRPQSSSLASSMSGAASSGASAQPRTAFTPGNSPITPAGWTDEQYVQSLQDRAARLSLSPLTAKSAEMYQKRAQDVLDWQKNTFNTNMRFDPTIAGQRAGSEAAATLPYKVAQAGQEAATKLPYDIARSNAEAQGRVAAENTALTPDQKNAAGAGLTIPQFEASKAEATGQAKDLAELPGKLDAAAANARLNTNVLDEMSSQAGSFRMGWNANVDQGLRLGLQGIGKSLGIDVSSLDRPIASYEDFTKLSGNLVRNALSETGTQTRGGIQLANLFGRALPSGEMSELGFKTVASQLKGVNDFAVAKQQIGQQWADAHGGSYKGFPAAWNQNISPSVFVAQRMSLEDPEGLKQTLSRMAGTPAGRAALKDLQAQRAWATQHGLFGN